MRNRISLIAAMLLLTLTANAQKKTDREQEGLSGPVRSVRVERVSVTRRDGKDVEGQRVLSHIDNYDVAGNKTERAVYRDGSLIERLVYTFDALGRNIGYDEYASVIPGGLSVPRKHIYKLDDEGNQVGNLVYDSDGTLASRFVYKYGAKGRKTEETFFYHTGAEGGTLKYLYDSRENQIGMVNYLPDGTIPWRIENTYDGEGKLTARINYVGDLLRYKTTYTYDAKGRIKESEIQEFNREPNVLPPTHSPEPGKTVFTYDDEHRTKSEAVYQPNGTIRNKIVTTYDDNGREIQRTYYEYNEGGTLTSKDSVSGQIRGQTAIKTEYDSHGNWIKHVWGVQGENKDVFVPHFAEYRIIAYY